MGSVGDKLGVRIKWEERLSVEAESRISCEGGDVEVGTVEGKRVVRTS